MKKILQFITITLPIIWALFLVNINLYAAFPVKPINLITKSTATSKKEVLTKGGVNLRNEIFSFPKRRRFYSPHRAPKKYYYINSQYKYASIISFVSAMLALGSLAAGAATASSAVMAVLFLAVLPISLAWSAIHFGRMGKLRGSRPQMLARLGFRIGLMLEIIYCVVLLIMFLAAFGVTSNAIKF